MCTLWKENRHQRTPSHITVSKSSQQTSNFQYTFVTNFVPRNEIKLCEPCRGNCTDGIVKQDDAEKSKKTHSDGAMFIEYTRTYLRRQLDSFTSFSTAVVLIRYEILD